MSIDCANPSRRRLVLSLARQAALSAPQSLLEEAVHTNNVELISNMQQILEKALKVNTNENDASLTHVNDAALKLPPGWTGPAEGCKPDGSNCNQGCFWLPICNGEAFHGVMSRSQKAVEESKALLARAVALDARRNRSRVAF